MRGDEFPHPGFKPSALGVRRIVTWLARTQLWLLLLLMGLVAVGPSAIAATTEVDVELVLAVDVSGSISDREHRLQRDGYVAAFRDLEVQRVIAAGLRGRIAVTYLEWGGPSGQRVIVPWRVIESPETAEAFAAELQPLPRSPLRGTSISGALLASSQLFDGNGIDSFRRVIDISGDGPNRSGPRLDLIRAQIVDGGVVINGLPIMISPVVSQRFDGYGLDEYFSACVIGGPASFVYPVLEESEMAEAIRRKLILELSGLAPKRGLDGGAPSVRPTTATETSMINCAVNVGFSEPW